MIRDISACSRVFHRGVEKFSGRSRRKSKTFGVCVALVVAAIPSVGLSPKLGTETCWTTSVGNANNDCISFTITPSGQLQVFRQVSWNRQQACRIGAGAAPAFSVPRSLYGKWIFVAFLYTFW